MVDLQYKMQRIMNIIEFYQYINTISTLTKIQIQSGTAPAIYEGLLLICVPVPSQNSACNFCGDKKI